ncbi:hypothetical protein MSG28_011072 [Choristoneura fumiferana]|uniref:Uncharacterized protein n=1 Tax=Choristoneura fumiferana TaxID=7141 RepID=A0ACC0KRG7_CHOFU|nr:hypothetical protein MSG28_011072 [Choristoneura fumiferana]
MVSRGFVLTCHGVVWVAALALWAAGASAAARYDTATPHTPPYKYIPLRSNYGTYSSGLASSPPADPPSSDSGSEGGGMAPSEFILTALRTALDVVRTINKKRASSPPSNTTALVQRGTRVKNNTIASGRGFDDYYDEHHHETTTTAKPMKQGRYTDPWAGYYDWIINEGSFKFWSAFQLFTAALLLYACLSAIYYAKFNPILPDYDREYDDYFLERTVGRQARSLSPWELPSGLSWINPRTFQFILDAIATHYKEE